MSEIQLETNLSPTEQDITPIRQGLYDFNLSRLGAKVIDNYVRIAVTAKDAQGNIAGGIFGECYWDWMHVDTLWVDEAHRGHDLGTRLLSQAEEAARSRGFFKIHLETTSFQALGFYQKNGYQVFGQLEGKPAGVTWYFLKKEPQATTRQMEATE